MSAVQTCWEWQPPAPVTLINFRFELLVGRSSLVPWQAGIRPYFLAIWVFRDRPQSNPASLPHQLFDGLSISDILYWFKRMSIDQFIYFLRNVYVGLQFENIMTTMCQALGTHHWTRRAPAKKWEWRRGLNAVMSAVRWASTGYCGGKWRMD